MSAATIEAPRQKAVRIHPTALIEPDVEIGDGTSVWDNVHIRHSTAIGEQCIIGEKTYIAYNVRIGNRVKLRHNIAPAIVKPEPRTTGVTPR